MNKLIASTLLVIAPTVNAWTGVIQCEGENQVTPPTKWTVYQNQVTSHFPSGNSFNIGELSVQKSTTWTAYTFTADAATGNITTVMIDNTTNRGSYTFVRRNGGHILNTSISPVDNCKVTPVKDNNND